MPAAVASRSAPFLPRRMWARKKKKKWRQSSADLKHMCFICIIPPPDWQKGRNQWGKWNQSWGSKSTRSMSQPSHCTQRTLMYFFFFYFKNKKKNSCWLMKRWHCVFDASRRRRCSTLKASVNHGDNQPKVLFWCKCNAGDKNESVTTNLSLAGSTKAQQSHNGVKGFSSDTLEISHVRCFCDTFAGKVTLFCVFFL